MIEIKSVSKSYQTIKANQDISLSIGDNLLFGLIGPDGAGKTTLLRLITTLLEPDRGNISVFGYDTVSEFRKIRLITGYMPGRFSLYPDLTVEENLSFYATIFKTTVKENYHLIKPVYSFLEPFRDRLARNLSGGMKQKLALCCALIHNPALLVLDEPTTGVDAVSRKEFWETLQFLKQSGMTILVSTPYMDEAALCDRVALMQNGKILQENTPESILKVFKDPLFEIRAGDRLNMLKTLRLVPEIKRAYLFGHSIHVTLNHVQYDKVWLDKLLISKSIHDYTITAIKPDFEDCFIDVVEHDKLINK